MARYCIESGIDGHTIHRVDCDAYDLGTLLGLGCLGDLGEFRSAAQALETNREAHPDAVLCRNCCKAEVKRLPQLWHQRGSIALPLV